MFHDFAVQGGCSFWWAFLAFLALAWVSHHWLAHQPQVQLAVHQHLVRPRVLVVMVTM